MLYNHFVFDILDALNKAYENKEEKVKKLPFQQENLKKHWNNNRRERNMNFIMYFFFTSIISFIYINIKLDI